MRDMPALRRHRRSRTIVRAVAEVLERRRMLSVSGVDFSYYQGAFTSLPNFSSQTPVKTGLTHNFDLSIRAADTDYAFLWTGNIAIAAAGTYTFYTGSEDGSALLVDGVPIVNNDGIHSYAEVSGTDTLAAGTHTITVEYFESTGPQQLTTSYAGPGINKEPIPDSVLTATAPASVSVDSYGAVGDGTTNDSGAIQSAIDAAPDDATLTFDAGKTYLLGSGLVISRPLNVEGNGATLLLDTSAYPQNETAYESSGAAGTSYTWTQTVTAGQTTFNVPISTSMLLPGDTIFLQLGADPNDSTQPNWAEVCQVTANTGSAVTVNIAVPYNIAQGSRPNSIQRLTDVIQNVSFKDVNFNYVSGTTPDANLWLNMARNVTVSGITGNFTIMANVTDSQNITVTHCSGTLNKLDSSSGRLVSAYQTDGLTISNNAATTSYDAPIVFLESWARNTVINGLTINWNYGSPSAQDVFHFTGNSYATTADNITINNVGAIDLVESGGQASSYSFGKVNVSGTVKAAYYTQIGDLINDGNSYNQSTLVTSAGAVTVSSHDKGFQIPLCTGAIESISLSLSNLTGLDYIYAVNSAGGAVELTNPTAVGQTSVNPQAFGTDYPVNDAASPSKSLTITTGNVPAGTRLNYSVTYYPLAVPAVSSFVVDNGTAQRSMVRTFTLAFSTPVTLDSGAVTLSRVVNGTSTPLTYTSTTPDGGLTYLFTPTSSVGGGSLTDGDYSVVVTPSGVHNAEYSTTTMTVAPLTYTFFRLFGDSSGDGTVNLIDYRAFTSTYLKSSGQAGFNSIFDANNDGVINLLDYRDFISNYLKTIT